MRRILSSSSLAAMLFAATPAFAHTETVSLSSSFLSGLLHPLTGFDHLLALVAFGVWFSFQNTAQQRSLPLTVIAALIGGFAIGLTGLNLPIVEGGILSSVLVMGLLIATTTKLKTTLALPLIAGFTFFHGFAHGAEIGSALAVLFMAGFLLSCATTMLVTSKITQAVQAKLPAATKFIGLMIAMTGLSLIAS